MILIFSFALLSMNHAIINIYSPIALSKKITLEQSKTHGKDKKQVKNENVKGIVFVIFLYI